SPSVSKTVSLVGKRGTALHVSGSVCQMSVCVCVFQQEKPKLIDPLDYEAVICDLGDELKEDPLRELLLFPDNDFTVGGLYVLVRLRRVCECHPVSVKSVCMSPTNDLLSLILFACEYYNSQLHVVHYKYDEYAGDYRLLPRYRTGYERVAKLRQLSQNTQVFQRCCESYQNFATLVYDYTNVQSSSFKRRYFQLTQLTDNSYIMNFYKDEKISKEPKGCIFLDSCTGVVQNNRLRKYAFELKMNEVTYFVLAAESEQDMEEWISTLTRILQISPNDGPTPLTQLDRKNVDLIDTRQGEYSGPPYRFRISFPSPNPNRYHYPREEYPRGEGLPIRPFEEKLGRRLMIACGSLNLTLQGCINETETGPVTNIEPFFVTVALLDVREGRKVSADFHVDLNHETVRQMLGGAGSGGPGAGQENEKRYLLLSCVCVTCTQAIFSVTNPHTDIVLVARVEKVLMGNIAVGTEPYIKNTDSSKMVQKMLKSNKQFCSKLGKYHMPFAWCIRSVFKDNQGTVDRESRFSPLFKQESNKISTEDLIKLVSEYRRAEKTSKLQTIPGNLDITVDYVPMEHPNCVTSSYVPVKPFEVCSQHQATVEVEEFVQDSTKFTQPHHVYKNHVYVYPRHLKYDSQKSFAKARNLAVYVEFRSSDEEVAKPLKCIYGKPGGPVFTTAACSTVLHHSQNPDFYDEVKIELPTQLHEKHHLLFSFYHVTCDINTKTNSKKKEALETPVGYSWLPLLREGRLASQDFNIPVACSLPSGYLLVKEPGSTKNGSDLKWVDGGKPIFKVSTNVLSTVYTQVRVWTYPCHEEKLDHYLHSYIKVWCSFHWDVSPVLQEKRGSDSFSWFFFELIVKSMAQHLVDSDNVKLPRPQRFPSTYLSRLESLFMTVSDHIFWKNKELAEETRSANLAVAAFVKVGITHITHKLHVLCEFKFEFLREVCNHEHYIPLSLPLPSAHITGQRSSGVHRDPIEVLDVPEYSLTGEFCRKHFLTGLLLRELGLALQDEQDLRHLALASLKNLMAKHSMDARYAMKVRHTRQRHAPDDNIMSPMLQHKEECVSSSFLLSLCLQFARPQSLIGFGSRFDKLDQAETRSLLMCFLHIMKTISEGETHSVTSMQVLLYNSLQYAPKGAIWEAHMLIVVHSLPQKQLLQDEGQNLLMKKVFDTYLLFFQINQSTSTLRHVFAALRLFIQKVFVLGKADLCGCLCYEILKCCNHRSSSTQTEASALLYFFMRKNFEFTKGKSIVRSHLQLIKAVSQLIADAGIGGSRFQQSLAIINNFANGDAPLKNTPLPAEVKDLTKRIRTVLMATSQMKEHEKDPEMLVDLQYSLANSYASTPELRRTWLESMAKIHVPSFSMGWAAFLCISPNVKEEGAMKEDTGTQDTPYTEDTLVEQLELCVDYLWKSERHELIADINKPVIAVFEKRRDFKRLSELYYDIHRSYLKVTEVVNSEKRLFGRYYRVAFYGLGFFEEEESKEFIYKEPKLTGLSEISQRLLKLYSDKFGADNVKMIQDSNKVNPKDLDPKYAYIQVTYVVPYFDDKEQQEKKTDFERHHNINRFVFETPFTLSGKKHGDVEEQCKRRTILTTNSTFPYLKKRIQVVEQQSTEMNPIEVAIDEMSCKVSELNQLCAMAEVDMIRLQLKLQGSVSVKVNAGPMAYARAFLEEKNAKRYPDNQVKLLKEIFRQFAEACGQALDVNERLIKEDQLEYQEEMRAHYRDMLTELSTVMNEQVCSIHVCTPLPTTSSPYSVHTHPDNTCLLSPAPSL
uniref:Dedicator of cytokinesis 10 n=1 Tax=Oncorhynchus kisutch TaxID=8019 RepID=A0A8C7FX29_ONCKI